jgi:hypothetical protein
VGGSIYSATITALHSARARRCHRDRERTWRACCSATSGMTPSSHSERVPISVEIALAERSHRNAHFGS